MFPDGWFGVYFILIVYCLGAGAIFGIPLGKVVVSVIENQQKKKLKQEEKDAYIRWSVLAVGFLVLLWRAPLAFEVLY